MSSEDQAQADSTDQTVSNPSDVENSQNGTNTALDDWHASVAAINLDESQESTQGEQSADETPEESQEEAEESEQSEEELEQISEEEDTEQEEDQEPEAKAKDRFRFKDPLDQKIAGVAKAMGVSLLEAAKIVEGQGTTKHQDKALDQSQGEVDAVDTVDSVQARIEELEELEATASESLEFTEANAHRRDANKLRNKLMDLKIAAVQQKAQSEQRETEKYHADYKKSEIKTVGLYPDSAKAGSPMVKEMARIEAEMLEMGDLLYHSSDKPFILAREAAKNLGIPMRKPGTAPVKKSVEHRPMQPASGTARTTTTDSARKASEAIEGLGSMRDYQNMVNSL